MIRGSVSIGRGSVNSHVKTETQTFRYIGKLIKRGNIVKKSFPLVGDERSDNG
jgi:hypothetical protein